MNALSADGPKWSPNGKRIVFTGFEASYPKNVRSGIYLIDADGHGLRRIA